MGVDDFRDDLRQTLEDPDRMVRFRVNHIGPFVDAVGTLSTWHGFSEEYREQLARGMTRATGSAIWTIRWSPRGWPSIAFGEPAVNPVRDVGRNDPCPCGSGKKYKKCCLGKEAG